MCKCMHVFDICVHMYHCLGAVVRRDQGICVNACMYSIYVYTCIIVLEQWSDVTKVYVKCIHIFSMYVYTCIIVLEQWSAVTKVYLQMHAYTRYMCIHVSLSWSSGPTSPRYIYIYIYRYIRNLCLYMIVVKQ